MKENVHMTRHFIAKEICDVITERCRLTPNEIKARIFKDFGLEIRYLKAWQARQQAFKGVFGEWDESFQKLPHFMQAVVDSNPGTFVKWHRTRDEDNECMIINRVFWAFGPCVAAFSHCRPVMCIDGTHMYGKYDAKLLMAVALDANNHLLPVAFALVESENNSSWNWFMKCIREGMTKRDEICVISDQHKGIINAMQDADWVAPHAYHRVCIRHLQSNFNVKVKNLTLKKKLGHLAHQRQGIKFDLEYKDLINLVLDKPQIVNWLDSIPRSQWSLAYDEGGRRWGSMTTNASECFNNVLKGGRYLPICALVKFTFLQCNSYFCKRRGAYQSCYGLFPPKIQLKMSEIKEKANYHRVQVFNAARGIYQVTTFRKHRIHEVNLTEGTCSCSKWEAFHYPCSHVLAVCKGEGIRYTQFVDQHYTLEAYFATWSYTFNVLRDEQHWRPYEGLAHVANSNFKRNVVGRNPSRRRHNEMDQGASSSKGPSRIVKCGLCRAPGHNRRACPSRQPN